MKTAKYLLPLIFLLLFAAPPVHAIPKDLQAKSKIRLAETQVESGAYMDATMNLEAAKVLLGDSSGHIQYLLTVSYYQLKQYVLAKRELEKYFTFVSAEPKAKEAKEEYNTMVTLIAQIDEGLAGKNPPPLTLASSAPAQTGSPATKPKKSSLPAEKKKSSNQWLSLKEASTSGVPVPHPKEWLRFKVGRTIVTEEKLTGVTKKSEPGLLMANITKVPVKMGIRRITTFHGMNQDKTKAEFTLANEDIFTGQNTYGPERRTWSSHIYKNPTFPVSVLAPGVTFTSKERIRKHDREIVDYPLDVQMRVEGFQKMIGQDCLKMSGKTSRVLERNLTISIDVEKCYDYNNGLYLYTKRHFVRNEGEIIHKDLLEEFRVVSIKDN